MAKKLIALILAVMLVLSLMSPVYAVSKPVAATGTVSRTVKVGVINYLADELGTSNWQIHYWGSTIDADDAQLERDGEATESRSVGEAFWNNAAQTFLMFTATIPAQATGFKVHHGDRWFGEDGTAGQTAYVFNYDGDKALYVTNATPEPTSAPATVAPVTEAPVTEAPATEAAKTITVKFTDALYWGDVHVYYWDNGAEWPGKAMDKAEVNEYSQQVYTAEVYHREYRGRRSVVHR
nr:hypothetical protein [uncultured Ruminococcus sp.]